MSEFKMFIKDFNRDEIIPSLICQTPERISTHTYHILSGADFGSYCFFRFRSKTI